jgi:hypothetical protein
VVVTAARVGRAAAMMLLLMAVLPAATHALLLDGFEELTDWTVGTAPGVSLELAQDEGRTGRAMRLDFDFRGNAGYVIARKAIDLSLPPYYAFKLAVRGDAPVNNLEFKLVDPAGNVYWRTWRDFEFAHDWRVLTVKKSRLDWAWGPAGGGTPSRVAFLEIAVSAGTGGQGSVWVDDLTFEERPAPTRTPVTPNVSASTSVPGHEPPLATDGDPATAWRSGTVAPEQWLMIDFDRTYEYGGFVVDWDPDDFAVEYRVVISDDAQEWTSVFESTTGNGGRDYVYVPEGESRYVLLELRRSSRGQGYAIRELAVQPDTLSESPNRFFEVVARDARPGMYPKYLSGRQSYWTVAGADGDDAEALINEEGAIEVGTRGFMLEPFVHTGGELVTWNDVATTQELEGGSLPIPSVTWRRDGLRLRVTALAAGDAGDSTLYAIYEVSNDGFVAQDLSLYVAVRPFQVLPPWQNLNLVGGVSPIRSLELDARTVWVNDTRPVTSLTTPDRFGAANFEQALVENFLAHAKLPTETSVVDPFGYAAGAFEYRLGLTPGASATVRLAVPFHRTRHDGRGAMAAIEPGEIENIRARTAAAWDERLGRVELRLPRDAADLIASARATLGYILVNRDGPAIQPGSRTYARSWIRDGAFTSSALLALGHTVEPRQFVEWFARHQLPDGRVPCCIDQRGVDPTPEHDSDGELIYTIAEYYRFTRDVGLVHALWPHVVRAAESIAAMRAQRLGDDYAQGDRLKFRGLLPESISHEGYASRPVHSYWDDFFALRGLKDAAALAAVLADDARASQFGAVRDAFRLDLLASIQRVMEEKGLDYLPASADLGDFDPTSTAIAVSPGGELPHLPRAALERTFERYWDHVRPRLDGTWQGEAYTAYEFRNVEVLVRLGQRERALQLLQSLVADQRPRGWHVWPEITWRDPTLPRFIGDMPHGWIGSCFLHALRSLFVYEREEDDALVLAAGIAPAWLADGSGIELKRLPTHHGVLSYAIARAADGGLRIRISGDLDVPSGGIVVQPPLERPLARATVNGQVTATEGGAIVVREFPADVLLEY